MADTRDRAPEWIDRRTLEWCAQLCEATAVRIITHDRRRGAEACAAHLRWHLAQDTRSLPRNRSMVVDNRTSELLAANNREVERRRAEELLPAAPSKAASVCWRIK